MNRPTCDAQTRPSVPGKITAFLLLLGLLLAGCRTYPKESTPIPMAQPPLALETFDAVWTLIHDHHFDTNFSGVDWPQARLDFRPRVRAAESSQEVRDIIQEMLDLLAVSHLAIVPSHLAEVASTGEESAQPEPADVAHAGTTGLHIRFNENKALVTRVEPGTPAAQAGIQPGWRLLKIGEDPVASLSEGLPDQFDSARKLFLLWRKASNLLDGEPGTEVTLSFVNADDAPVTLTLPRVLRPGEPIQFGGLPVLYADLDSTTVRDHPRIGLIRFNIWMLPTAIAFNQAIEQHRQADGIIIDLRGNVGGVIGMIIGVAGHFFTESLSLGTLVTRDNRLNLFVNPRFVSPSGQRVQPYSGPVAILVDETSASASEVFAGGLKELGRARIFGRTTSGQALPAVYETLPNGDALYRPFGDFITETGVRFEGKGVVPDQIIPLDRAALLSGRDPALQAAIDWIAAQAD